MMANYGIDYRTNNAVYTSIVNELGQTATKKQAEQILASYIYQGLDDYYADALLEWINTAWN